jgi:hypothetical protein
MVHDPFVCVNLHIEYDYLEMMPSHALNLLNIGNEWVLGKVRGNEKCMMCMSCDQCKKSRVYVRLPRGRHFFQKLKSASRLDFDFFFDQ